MQEELIPKQLCKYVYECVKVYKDLDSRISMSLDVKWLAEDLCKVTMRPKKNLFIVGNGCTLVNRF